MPARCGAGSIWRWILATVRKTLANLSGKRDSALIGLRLGATLALRETLRVGGECVVALAPVVNGAAQVRLWKMRSKIRSELSAQTPGRQVRQDKSPLPIQRRWISTATMCILSFLMMSPVSIYSRTFRRAILFQPTLCNCRIGLDGAAPETAQLKDVLGSRAKLNCMRMEPFWDKVDDADTGALEAPLLQFMGSL